MLSSNRSLSLLSSSTLISSSIKLISSSKNSPSSTSSSSKRENLDAEISISSVFSGVGVCDLPILAGETKDQLFPSVLTSPPLSISLSSPLFFEYTFFSIPSC
ncbi:hypothetical protein DY000_02016915 [Brassica cretica]|uniref:Uncharacterized protein n=1 Tax=Brassica cretica TaxID=69181 RepID=A0ABQ7CTK7_BRACR|nr:hypothetical protein DY000_02016915 [Brassica cretica]